MDEQINTEKQFKFGDFFLWFPKESKSYLGKFIRKLFIPYKIQYMLPNNIVLLMVTLTLNLTLCW
jgi:hypothetical protein